MCSGSLVRNRSPTPTVKSNLDMSVVLDQQNLPASNGSAPPVPLLLAAVLALILSLAALKYLAHPFGWIATCWVACFTYWALFSRNVAVRLFCVNAAIVALGGGLSELILRHREEVATALTTTKEARRSGTTGSGWLPDRRQ